MHQITDETRELVVSLKAIGCTNEQTARVLKIGTRTLERRYREELATGIHEVHAKVARTLFQKALDGDIAACIFIAKSRLGWSEKTVLKVEPGESPLKSAYDYTDEELLRIVEGG